MSSISGLSSSYLQSILNTAVQRNGSSAGTEANLGIDALSAQQPDSGHLSPFAQLMSTLQQLQQSDPTKYKEVTQKIATSLENAAKTATSDGNNALATQLNTLATDFTNAAQTGDPPNIQDLANSVAGGMRPPSGPPPFLAGPDSGDGSTTTSGTGRTSSSSAEGSTSAHDLLKTLLASFESGQTQSDALNPMSIIMKALSNAGINTNN